MRKQGIINIIRKKYKGNMELAYNIENNINNVFFCENCHVTPAKFINYHNGYSKFCNNCSKEISYNNSIKGLKDRKLTIDNFLFYYNNNSEFYPSSRKTPCFSAVI